MGGNHNCCTAFGDRELDDALSKARDSEKWFVSVLSVDDRGDCHTYIKTNEFPHARFVEAVRQMRKFIYGEESKTGLGDPGGDARFAFGILLALVDVAEKNGVINSSKAAPLNRAMAEVQRFIDKVSEEGLQPNAPKIPQPPQPTIYTPRQQGPD